MKKKIVLLTFTLITLLAQAQEKPALNINQLDWLVGHWVGNGFGGVSEEVWAPAADGTMMGMYRNIKDGKVVFYEFLHITKEGMRLKHFNPDLSAWEDKEDMVMFDFVKSDENSIEFKGLKITKKEENRMEIELKLRQKGELVTEVFSFMRK